MLPLPAVLQGGPECKLLPDHAAAHQPLYCLQDVCLQGHASPWGLKGSLCMLCAGVGCVKGQWEVHFVGGRSLPAPLGLNLGADRICSRGALRSAI